MKKLLLTGLLATTAFAAGAQSFQEWRDPEARRLMP